MDQQNNNNRQRSREDDEILEKAECLVRAFAVERRGWGEHDCVETSIVKGGITNVLVKVRRRTDDEKILVRFFGQLNPRSSLLFISFLYLYRTRIGNYFEPRQRENRMYYNII